MNNIFIEPGHYEFTWEFEKAKGIQSKDGLFQEFDDFNIKATEYLVPLLQQHSCFKVHQLELNNNKLDKTLRQRIDYINANCGKYGNDLVISIHANYNSNPELKGLDLFYATDNGKKLCELFIKHSKDNAIKYRMMFQCKIGEWTDFGIVLRVKPISILIECGYFSNDNDRALLRKAMYQKQIAVSVYKMVCENFKIEPILKTEKEKPVIEEWKMIEVRNAIKYGYLDSDVWANEIDDMFPRWAVLEMLNDVCESFQVKIDKLNKKIDEINVT